MGRLCGLLLGIVKVVSLGALGVLLTLAYCLVWLQEKER